MSTPTLRQWQESDFEPYAAMNADPEVMRWFLAPMSRDESRGQFDRLRSALDKRGWGVWAVEVDGTLAGMVGLDVPRWQLPCSPCTEVLWRLRREFWGRGIASAAAAEAIDHGFTKLGLEAIIAITTPPNVRSIRLMERLGLVRDLAGDFDHPAVPAGHPLRRHVLYRKRRPPLLLRPKSVAEARAMYESMTPEVRAQVSPAWVARVFGPAGADRWSLGFTLVRPEDDRPVGQAGYTAPPQNGVVEIAYGVDPEFGRRGYATAAARELVRLAFGSPEVCRVIAHTLAPDNASAHVLAKAGL
jgi:RimJ/RimL family protein N-acetyltransferase